MPHRRKKVYVYRTTHGRRAQLRTAVIILIFILILLAVGILGTYLSDLWTKGKKRPPAPKPAPPTTEHFSPFAT